MNNNQETQPADSQPHQTEPQEVKPVDVQPVEAAEGQETAEESGKSDEEKTSEGNKQETVKDAQEIQEKEHEETKEEPKEVPTEAKKMDPWCEKAINDGMKVFEEVFPIEKWQLENESDGIKTFSRYDEGTGLKMTRGEGAIARPLDQIKDVLMNPSEVLKWEGSLIANDIVEKTDEYTIIQSLDQKRPFVTQRETLIIIKSFQREDGSTVVIERSVDHPKFPERSEYVRAFVHLWACILKPNKEDPNKTDTTFIIFLDPKGWVPKALFNAVVNGQALNVQKLKTYLEKH